MDNKALIEKLNSLGACNKAIVWLGKRDSQQMYDDCDRVDWLFWLAKKLGLDEMKLHLIECKIAKAELYYYEELFPNDKRLRQAIDAKEKWLRKEITDEELDIAVMEGARSPISAKMIKANIDKSAHQANIFREHFSFDELEIGLNKI